MKTYTIEVNEDQLQILINGLAHRYLKIIGHKAPRIPKMRESERAMYAADYSVLLDKLMEMKKSK